MFLTFLLVLAEKTMLGIFEKLVFVDLKLVLWIIFSLFDIWRVFAWNSDMVYLVSELENIT